MIRVQSLLFSQSEIFAGFGSDELATALDALSASRRRYRKGERILSAGSPTDRMGFVEEGSVVIERVEMNGQRTVLAAVKSGDFFAETYALVPEEPMMVDASANEETTVIWLKVGALGKMASRESWLVKLQRNLLRIAARKNLALSRRAFVTAPKSARERIVFYLQLAERKAKADRGGEFAIPFDRQQLADYLNLDRSALSRELGRMRKEGIVLFGKNRFTLLWQQNCEAR